MNDTAFYRMTVREAFEALGTSEKGLAADEAERGGGFDPFARDYAGYLDNRSFGGAQVSRTFYARGQTGQQLLLGAYSALSRQIGLGKVKMYNRSEMLDLVLD